MRKGTITMRSAFSRLLTVFLLCFAPFPSAAESPSVVAQKFPHTEGLEILCWVAPQDGKGYLSQIVIFQADSDEPANVLWQSHLDPAYSPEIRFVEEITASGLPIALVERQNGAATSQLDVVAKVSGRFQSLAQIDGFKFEVEHLDGSKLPFIIAHTDGNILDVPVIYRWTGRRFVEDSASHQAYYRQLLSEDKAKLPPNSSGIVLVNLSKVALLSGNRLEARTILNDALSRERSKGDAANKETLRDIREALRSLERGPR